MHLAPLAEFNATADRLGAGSLREPQVAGDLLSLIQMLHERVEILERDNESLRAECRLASEFRLIIHERMMRAEGQ